MLHCAALTSGDGAGLQALLDSVFFGELPGFELAALIATEPEAYALSRARGAGVPAYVVDHSLFPNGASFNLALLRKLQDLDIDCLLLAGFAPRLGEGTAQVYRGRALAVREALVPAFDGLPDGELCAAALARGLRWTGVTVCLLDEGGRPGEVLCQRPVEILPGDDEDALRRRMREQAVWPLLTEAVRLLAARFS